MKKLALAIAIAAALTGCSGGEETSNSSSGNNNVSTTVSVRTSSVDIKEGDEGFTTLNITVQASRNADSDITVNFLTEDGTGKAGADYVQTSGSTIIRQGTRTVDIPIQIMANTIHQGNRDLKFVISGVTGTGNVSKGNGDNTTIRISDDDPEPVASFVTERTMVTEGVGLVGIDVRLDRQSEKATTVRFALSGLATRDVDYRVDSTEITLPAMATSAKFDVRIVEDNLVEGTEDLQIKMQSVINGKAGTLGTTVVLVSGDLKLPDTGVTRFYNNGQLNSTSPDSAHPYQDASYGWDTDAAYQNNGYAGFVYQKIDFDGNPVSASRQDHSCVYDSLTGLTWEVKRPINPKPNLEDEVEQKEAMLRYANENWGSKENRYLWNSPITANNGGVIGGINANEFDSVPYVSENCTFPDRDHPLFVAVANTGCTSNKFVEIYNKSATCGFKDWRLPTAQELSTIVNFESNQTHLDSDYFKDERYPFSTNRDAIRYLSDTPSVDNSASVWCLNADSRNIELCNKQSYHHIRLVRGAKL